VSNMNVEILESIENPVVVNVYGEFPKIDLIVPERTILQYKNHKFHIYKACYLKRLRGKSAKNASIVKSSICPKRKEIVRKIIRKSPNVPKFKVCGLLAIFDWLDDNGRSDSLFSQSKALETYKVFSEALYSEARSSEIKGRKRQRRTLRQRQEQMSFLLSIASGLSEKRLQASAVMIERFGMYAKSQKRTAPENAMVEFFLLNLRHFTAISSFLLNDENLPLVIKRSDIGFPDFKQWTFTLHSNSLVKAKENNTRIAQFFNEEDEFIFDHEEAYARTKELGQDDYRGTDHRKYISLILDGDERLRRNLFRRAGIHFSHLLLLVSGCNVEQLEYIDFSKKLTNSAEAKRETAVKPRAGYASRPVQFSAKFVSIWRTYLKLRDLTIQTFDPNFGKFGIPLILEGRKGLSSNKLYPANSNNIRMSSLNNNTFGFPVGYKAPTSKSARDFKTINFLDYTKGDIDRVSKAMGRSHQVTRKNYAYNSFEDSSKQLTTFFDALTKKASIKAKGYNPSAPIHNEGAQVYIGSCDTKDESPRKIEGVTDEAPEPRCGAPVTCIFCVHYGHHADVHDIKLILSAKAWLNKQTKVISRNLEEHVSKFLPFIERIEDIIDDFRTSSDEYNSVYEKAQKEVDAGNYSPYWRNKIDAFLSALESEI